MGDMRHYRNVSAMWSGLCITVSAPPLRDTAMSNFFDVRKWYRLIFLQDDGRCRRGPDYRVQREVLDWRGDRTRSTSAPAEPKASDTEVRVTPKGTPSTPRSYLRRDAKWDSVNALDREIVVSSTGKAADIPSDDSKKAPSPVVPSDGQHTVPVSGKVSLYATSDYETINITHSDTEKTAENDEADGSAMTRAEGNSAEKPSSEVEANGNVLSHAAAVAEELRKVLTVVEKSSPKQGVRRRSDGSQAADKEFIVYASVNKEKSPTDQNSRVPKGGQAEEIENPPVPPKSWENSEVNPVSQQPSDGARKPQLSGVEIEAGSQSPTSPGSAGKKRVFRFPSLRKIRKTSSYSQDSHTDDTPVIPPGDAEQPDGHLLIDPTRPAGKPFQSTEESFQHHSNVPPTAPGKRTRLKDLFKPAPPTKSHPAEIGRPWWQGAARGKMEWGASRQEPHRPTRPPRTSARRQKEPPAQSQPETSTAIEGHQEEQESTDYVPDFPLSGTLV